MARASRSAHRRLWTRSVEAGAGATSVRGNVGNRCSLTMAAVAKHVAVQEGHRDGRSRRTCCRAEGHRESVAAEAAGDEPATAGDGAGDVAGDGAGDDKPAEPCTKRRKTHMPRFCSLARV